MIVITNIEYLETNRNPIELIREHGHSGFIPCKGNQVIETKVMLELVRGRHFHRPDGTEICIGMSRQAQDILGLQYDIWDNMRQELDAADSEIASLRKKLSEYIGVRKDIEDARSASFITRVKWLLFGFR